MKGTLAEFLLKDPALRALGILSRSGTPRGVREMADLCGLSPRGATLVLGRLVAAGLCRPAGTKRRFRYVSDLTAQDRKLLGDILRPQEIRILEGDAVSRSRRVEKALMWIDPTLRGLKRIRRRARGTHSAS